MKYGLWLILLFALSSLGAESWTILVYMAADNNLSQQGKLDINSMESVALPSGLTIIVQADFPEGAKRYRIQQDSSDSVTSPVIADLGSIDSGNPQTLNSFIRWGLATYPAQRRMVVIWSHGDSWYKHGNAVPRVFSETDMDKPPPESKWLCPDDGAMNLMSISNGDLAVAFASVPKLDILLFDACSMQGIEVLNEVYGYADYVIGSADLVPADGFPYENIIPLFGGSFEQILQEIPLLYVESYLPGGAINWGSQYWVTTCSTIQTANIPQFFSAFKGFATHNRQFASEIYNIRSQCFAMNTGYADVDLKEFLGWLANSGIAGLNSAAGELANRWNEMVVSSASTSPGMVADIGTAALWFPDSWFNFNNGWQIYYKLAFAKTRWLSVVQHALGADEAAPESPALVAQSVQYQTLRLSLTPAPDPDSVYYELVIGATKGFRGVYTFFPNPDASIFSIAAPVTSAGTYSLYAIDQSGNRSLPVTGSYSYSSPVSSLSVFPNPVRNKHLASVRWWAGSELSGNITLEIYNLKGQRVVSRGLGSVIPGEGNFLLSTDDSFLSLAAGIYFLKLSLGGQHFQQKLSILY